MAKVTVYTRAFCPYCTRAIRLLQSKGVAFEQIDAGMDGGLRREMMERSGGGRTFPQIIIDDQPVGGCDELHALDRQGKLDGMLGLS